MYLVDSFFYFLPCRGDAIAPNRADREAPETQLGAVIDGTQKCSDWTG
jgi:hypothetical protein